jgi:GR25 family glycosyltransferase involved in LPS biosynthesis
MDTPAGAPRHYDPSDFEKAPDAGGHAESSQDFRRCFDAVYCISLKDQPERAAAAYERLRAQGLSRGLTFYRPARGRHFPRAVWASHRAVACHALDQGHARVLILEDDLHFRVDGNAMLRRLARSMARLPEEWWGYYLGHAPMQMYFKRIDLLRVRSACAHAYVANKPLLHWLAASEPMDPEIRVSAAIGFSIDAAFANLPHMYAVFPMIALQGFAGDHRVDPKRDAAGRRRSLFDFARYRPLLLFHGLRLAEAGGVLLSPLHWLTLEFLRRRSGREISEQARELRASGAFDQGYYLRTYPDVAASGRVPLEHYLRDGRAEGRRINAA